MKVQLTENGKNRMFGFVPYLGVIFVFVLFGILTKGMLFTVPSLLNLVNNGLAMMICSIAAVPVFARGDLDFSIGSTQGVCILLTGYIVVQNISNAWLGLLVCLLVGSFIGFLNGVVVTVLKIPSFVATISMNYILRGLIYTLIAFKEVTYPVTYAGNYSVIWCIAILISILLITYILMEKTRFGKVNKLHGENANAVIFSGIKDNLFGILSFIYLGFVVGISSFLVSPRFSLVQASVGGTLGIDVLVACMIGGLSMRGGVGAKVSRPLIGSVIIALLNQSYALLNVASSINQFTKGFLFVIVLAITAPISLNSLRKTARSKSKTLLL